MNKVAVIGMAGNSAFLSVEHFHVGGETVAAKAIHFEPGGKGFNQAVAAARFGAEVSFLCAVGTEYLEEIRRYLIHDGILPVLAQKNEPTAFASILTDASGANQVTVYQGARLAPEDVDLFAQQIADADILLLNNEVPQAVNLRAAEIAKKHGTCVILNPAPAVPLPDALKAAVDLFTPNAHETAGLEQMQNVIVTLGADGCLIRSTGETIPALRLPLVVDTTGAGDTFNGVLAAGLAAGSKLSAAAADAIRASGVSVTRKYAASAIPSAAEVSEYLKNLN